MRKIDDNVTWANRLVQRNYEERARECNKQEQNNHMFSCQIPTICPSVRRPFFNRAAFWASELLLAQVAADNSRSNVGHGLSERGSKERLVSGFFFVVEQAKHSNFLAWSNPF